MNFFLIARLLILIISILQFQISLLAKDRIGIMDFTESEGLPRNTGKTAAAHAITALLDSQKFTVIEKSTIEFILKEQALQKQGCTDTECAIQTGKLIAANLMLTGNIIELNKKFIISINIRNIEQGKVEFSETMSIASLKELESTITESITRFVDKTVQETPIKINEKPTLSEKQEQAFAFSYVWPGLGHLTSGQKIKGSIFMAGSLYYFKNWLITTPSLNKESTQAIIQNYRAGIVTLGTIDTTSNSGRYTATAMYNVIFQDELKRKSEMHARTLNSGYLLLAAFTIIHTDLHITILDNFIFKYFRYFYLNVFPEKPINSTFFPERQSFNPRYDITFTWTF